MFDDDINHKGDVKKSKQKSNAFKNTGRSKPPTKDRFMADFDKMFAQRIEYLPSHIPLSKKTILQVIFKVVIKVRFFNQSAGLKHFE